MAKKRNVHDVQKLISTKLGELEHELLGIAEDMLVGRTVYVGLYYDRLVKCRITGIEGIDPLILERDKRVARLRVNVSPAGGAGEFRVELQNCYPDKRTWEKEVAVREVMGHRYNARNKSSMRNDCKQSLRKINESLDSLSAGERYELGRSLGVLVEMEHLPPPDDEDSKSKYIVEVLGHCIDARLCTRDGEAALWILSRWVSRTAAGFKPKVTLKDVGVDPRALKAKLGQG